jgi:tripartite-type tricarboxylate transporter receptor subunit TctC
MYRFLALLVCVGTALAAPAAAQVDFPTRPIRIIVPFSAGGANDILARLVGQRMSETLKTPVIVENRSGANGAIGMDMVARAAPDGYTIAVTSAGTLALAIALQQQLPYDTFKQFTPVTLMVRIPEVLISAPGLPAHTIHDLIVLARTQPGTLTFASSGVGSMSHLTGELFRASVKINITHVPYNGGSPAINDLIGQHVQIGFFDLSTVLPIVGAKQIRAIAVASEERASALPSVPTTAELGYPQVRANNWYGMVAPIATPPAVIARLHDAVVEAISDPDLRQKLWNQGMILEGDSPNEFAAFIQSEIDKWGKVAKAAGLAKN